MRTYLGLAFCALAACGSVKDNSVDAMGGGDDTGGGDFTLSVAPGSIDIPIASSGTVTVTIDRTGTVGDVMLSTQTLPAGITASFDPNPVPAASATVTFSVAGGTVPGASSVTIVGTAGGVQKTATVMINAKTINVAGTVVGGTQGVTVRIVGKPAVTTGAGGTFAYTDVTPPYDLYVVGQTGIFIPLTPTVNYYKGLTRSDPVVVQPTPSLLIGLQQGSSGTITGSKSGGDAVTPLHLVLDTGSTATASPPATYSFSGSWFPQATTHVAKLYGLQYTTRTTGAPDTWPGFGASGTTTITANTTNAMNLTLSAPTTAALTGQITAPSGFPTPSIQLNQQLGTTSFILWSSSATTTADATIPIVASGKATIYASAALGGAGTSMTDPGLAATKDITFALPAPPVQSAPLDSAVGVGTTTPFAWSATPMAVYVVQLYTTTTSGSAKASFRLYTADTTVTVPNIPELPLPTSQSFSWSVSSYGPNASVNDAASTTGLRDTSVYEFDGTRHFQTYSTSRSFTTGS